MERFKNFSFAIKNLLEWLYPFFGFLIIIFFVKSIFLKDVNFNEFIELLKILIWPFTVLLILFFFKKVFTYLLFSMDEFNFFGAKGSLKNVNEIILEEVEKKFLKEKEEEEQKKTMEKLNTEINKKKGKASVYLAIARKVMAEWKKSTKQNKETINNLTKENKRLREITSSFSTSPSVSPSRIKAPEIGAGEKTNDSTLGIPK